MITSTASIVRGDVEELGSGYRDRAKFVGAGLKPAPTVKYQPEWRHGDVQLNAPTVFIMLPERSFRKANLNLLTMSLSKGRSWFDRLTTNGINQSKKCC
jgi:hypothetical protein